MPGEQLLLINPRRRRRSHAKRRHRRVSARRHHPRRHRVRAHTEVVRRRRYRVRAHMANPRRHRRHHRRHHRNPLDMGGVVMPVAIGAIGAVGLDIVWGYISPMFGTTFTASPMLNIAAKAALAVGGGWAAGKALGRQKGRYIMAGALTVYGYELLESLVKQMAPTIPFAGMGAYMRPGMAGLGAYNPAPYLLPSASPVTPAGLGAYMQHPGMSGLGCGGSMGMF
jgi:hypothetical protein